MSADPGIVLPTLWEAAAAQVPVLIVGGGRWGRVWATVLSDAQGNAKNLVMAARTNPDAVRHWASSEPRFCDIEVCESIADAVASREGLQAAIICSRPQNHMADAIEAIRHGLHVLVEKPMATHADAAERMWVASQQARRKLSVGTEFAYLPALHQCAWEWGLSTRDVLDIRLRWEDPHLEARYGFTKSRHSEVGALGDLLPHALSIFGSLVPGRNFRIEGAGHTNGPDDGWIRLRDDRAGVYTLFFDLMSSKRVRCVELDAGEDRVVIDFADRQTAMSVNQQPHALDPRLGPLTSTLRLEWGGFIAPLLGAEPRNDGDPSVPIQIQLQRELEGLTR